MLSLSQLSGSHCTFLHFTCFPGPHHHITRGRGQQHNRSLGHPNTKTSVSPGRRIRVAGRQQARPVPSRPPEGWGPAASLLNMGRGSSEPKSQTQNWERRHGIFPNGQEALPVPRRGSGQRAFMRNESLLCKLPEPQAPKSTMAARGPASECAEHASGPIRPEDKWQEMS